LEQVVVPVWLDMQADLQAASASAPAAPASAQATLFSQPCWQSAV